jgi:hypothetical protein
MTLVLIDPEPGIWRTLLVPRNSAHDPSLRTPSFPNLIALLVRREEMKRSREQARHWVLREFDRRLHQRGRAAIKAKADPNTAVNLEAAAATRRSPRKDRSPTRHNAHPGTTWPSGFAL